MVKTTTKTANGSESGERNQHQEDAESRGHAFAALEAEQMGTCVQHGAERGESLGVMHRNGRNPTVASRAPTSTASAPLSTSKRRWPREALEPEAQNVGGAILPLPWCEYPACDESA